MTQSIVSSATTPILASATGKDLWRILYCTEVIAAEMARKSTTHPLTCETKQRRKVYSIIAILHSRIYAARVLLEGARPKSDRHSQVGGAPTIHGV